MTILTTFSQPVTPQSVSTASSCARLAGHLGLRTRSQVDTLA